MAVLSDYTSGTISLANGSTAVTGTGTLFDVAKFREGDTLQIQNLTAVIASVNSNTSLTLTAPWTGTTLTNAIYRARYLPDGARVTAQATTLIELLGNGVLSNLAELGVEEGKTPVGNAAGEYELVDASEFGIQDPKGSLEKLSALTLVANKALSTDGSGNAQQIDLGTLGRALLAMASGTNAQYVQGDGTLQAKSGLPVSTAQQTALNNKLNLTGGNLSGDIYSTGRFITEIAVGSSTTYSPQITTRIGSGIGTSILTELSPGNYSQGILQTTQGSGTAYNFIFRYGVGFISPGSVTGTAKNFEIDHTVDPDNYDLRHCAVESARVEVTYTGVVQLFNGRASVNVEDYFGVMKNTFLNLWADQEVANIQIQDSYDAVKCSRIDGVSFDIECQNSESDAFVVWTVNARRDDPYIRWEGCTFTDDEGRLIVEFEKEEQQ